MKVLDENGLQQVIEGLWMRMGTIEGSVVKNYIDKRDADVKKEIARVDIGARLVHELGWDYDSVDYYGDSTDGWRPSLLDVTKGDINHARQAWQEADEAGSTFEGSDIAIAPMMKIGDMAPVGVDSSEYRRGSSMFHQCANLGMVPKLDTRYTSTLDVMFRYCTSLQSLPPLDTANCTNFHSFLYGCSELTEVMGLDMGRAGVVDYMFSGCTKLRIIKLYNLGKAKSGLTLNLATTAWGWNHPGGRQSIIDTLLTNSYDRAAAGYTEAFTVVLSANTKPLLTEAELAAITAKGFTIA